MIELELPIDEYITRYPYPPYNEKEDAYFSFRPFFKNVSVKYPNSVGVEIGVYEGYNSIGVCRFCKPKKLYLVDPYLKYEEVIEGGFDAYSQEDWNALYNRAVEKLKGLPVEFVRETSERASVLLPDELDYAYLDGNHKIDNVVADMDFWYPKIRSCGMLGGHDILEPEVQQAVSMWLHKHKEYNNQFFYKWNDWWLFKV